MSFEEVRLGEIVEIISGGTPKTSVSEYWEPAEIKWVTAKDVSESSNGIIKDTQRKISIKGLEGSSARMLDPLTTVLIARGATTGKVALIQESMAMNQTCYGLKAKKGTDRLFLYYLMLSRYNSFRAIANGSIFETVIGAGIKHLTVQIPNHSEQVKIGKVLWEIDQKIELNNAINKNLEEMAQALFKRWFIDFEFPNENGEPYRSSGGEFEESELGLIPKGWRVLTAAELFDISIGRTPPRKESECFSNSNLDVKWLSIADMGKSGVFTNDTTEYLTAEAIRKYKVKVVPANTVVLSFKLTVGRVSILHENMATNEAIAHFCSDNKKITEYIYLYLKQFNFETLGNTSSIAKAVNSKTVKSMLILYPGDKVLSEFQKSIKGTFEKIKINQLEIKSLTSIRDTLLPKLMSGEIRVPLDEQELVISE